MCISYPQLQVATFVFAPFLLGEPLKGYRAMIIIFMLIGVSLITRPSWLGFPPDPMTEKTENDAEWYYYLVAISVPILAALVSILTRKCSHVLPSVLMFWFAMGCLICSVFGGIYVFTYRVIQDKLENCRRLFETVNNRWCSKT